MERVCTEMGLTGEMNEIWYQPPTPFDHGCIDTVSRVASELGFSSMPMISGAGHDAKYLAQVCPTGMIFIPCKDGISHNEIEDASKEDVAAGCNVLLQAMLAQAGR
jgi:N-carbamoyl-L-amino-acid hydrolase